ncbi:hypothetical protein K439DRAFT_1610339 [Ramaria rubella]|nr:hypothetical protein K439DRAFT_1610339 [Ramaria rubella]
MLNEQTNISPTKNSPTTLTQKCVDSPPSLVPSDYETDDFNLEYHAAHPQANGTSPFPNRDQREYMARYNRDVLFDDPVRNYASTMKHLEKLEQRQWVTLCATEARKIQHYDVVDVMEPTCAQKKHAPSIDTIEPTLDPESVSIVGPSCHQCSKDKDISLLEPPAKRQHVDNDMVGENSQLQKLLEEVRKIKDIQRNNQGTNGADSCSAESG